MLTKAERRLIEGLKYRRKIRRRTRLFLAEGPRTIATILQNEKVRIERIYAVQRWLRKHADLLQQRQIPWKVIRESELKQISSMETPNQVVALVEMPQWDVTIEQIVESPPPRMLFLDQIQEPGNLGTILRTACWFDVSVVVCSEHTVDVWNPKVVQATMGAIVYIPVLYANLEEILTEIRKKHAIPCVGTTLEGQPLPRVAPPTPPWICILGNEAHGVAPALLSLCTHQVTIPRYTAHPIDSLNVGVAAGILLAWLQRAVVGTPS